MDRLRPEQSRYVQQCLIAGQDIAKERYRAREFRQLATQMVRTPGTTAARLA